MSEGWTRQRARETPVEGRCLWCKVLPRDADPEVAFVAVGEHEMLCSRCKADLREFGRATMVQIWTAGGLDPAVKRIVQDAWSERVQPQLAELYREDDDLYSMPRIISDASKHDDPGLESESETHDND